MSRLDSLEWEKLPIVEEVFQISKFYVSKAVSEDELRLLSPDVRVRMLRDITRTMLLQLEADVWTKNLEEKTISVHYYASWWQHFKAEVFPPFLLKLSPPVQREEKIVVKAQALFPEITHTQYEPYLRITSLDYLRVPKD